MKVIHLKPPISEHEMRNQEPTITVTIQGQLISDIERRFRTAELSGCVTTIDVSLTAKDIDLMIASIDLAESLGMNYLTSQFSLVLHALFSVVRDVKFNGKSIMNELFSMLDPNIVGFGIEAEVSADYVDSEEGTSDFGIEIWLVTVPRKEDPVGIWFSVSREDLLSWREQLELIGQGIYSMEVTDGPTHDSL